MVDQLSQPVKNLIKKQASATPPKAQDDLLNHSEMSNDLKDYFQGDFPDNLYFQKAVKDDVLDPDLASETALKKINDAKEKQQQIRQSIQKYGDEKNITGLWA